MGADKNLKRLLRSLRAIAALSALGVSGACFWFGGSKGVEQWRQLDAVAQLDSGALALGWLTVLIPLVSGALAAAYGLWTLKTTMTHG